MAESVMHARTGVPSLEGVSLRSCGFRFVISRIRFFSRFHRVAFLGESETFPQNEEVAVTLLRD